MKTLPLSKAVSEVSEAQSIPLSDFASELGFEQHMVVRKQAFAEWIANRILRLFRISVISTVLLCVMLAGVDAWFIAQGWVKPSERLITEKVIIAIIGATIVQVGTATAAIVYSLFKQAPKKAEGRVS